ncbi:class 1 fructose-bisphosphatase [Faunimonas sp. B44]|uniref:class 1 fructose-bisphosphatase n=1 Tax=Faunimonas sp. B44 TaxID=3461493 RepID=UPI004044ADF9
MAVGWSLQAFLKAHAGDSDVRNAVGRTIQQIAIASCVVRDLINRGINHEKPSATAGQANADGDIQQQLDLTANRIFLAAIRSAPVACVASEELRDPVVLDLTQPLAVAIDPLDGSSNIETNVSIGTIFTILPAAGPEGSAEEAFLQPGDRQLAAGFFIYGPQLLLVLTLGAGTHVFAHSPREGGFVQIADGVHIPALTSEFAINASNYRHWGSAVRLYVDDCLSGEDGPRGRNFNMRWIASLVADAYRIFVRGGVFLYPGDERRGYRNGRLRLVYEANPIAMLVEQAGGAATDGVERILAITPQAVHQRVPLVFGSAGEVARIARYNLDPSLIAQRAPLFGHRGLFRV